MKKMLWFFIAMTMVLMLVTPVSLLCQEEPEEEEEPLQARPNPMAWVQLSKMESLKTLQIKELQEGQAVQINMNNIKQALGKAKIREKVSIVYMSPNGDSYHLGTYSPSAVMGKKRVGSGKNAVLINPQPEPPLFRHIPMIKMARKGAPGVPDSAAARVKGKGVLIFKNIKGIIKARIQLNPPVKDKLKHKDLSRAER